MYFASVHAHLFHHASQHQAGHHRGPLAGQLMSHGQTPASALPLLLQLEHASGRGGSQIAEREHCSLHACRRSGNSSGWRMQSSGQPVRQKRWASAFSVMFNLKSVWSALLLLQACPAHPACMLQLHLPCGEVLRWCTADEHAAQQLIFHASPISTTESH